MKNRDLKRYPTPAELYALEREARAMRSRQMAQLVRRAFDFIAKGRHHA
jgi:hypothetical protein